VDNLVYHRQPLLRERNLRRCRWGLLLVALFVAVAWTGTAMAGDPGLVDQYTEQVPTASGPKSTGNGGGGTPTPLPSSVQAQVNEQGGKDAKTLEKVATSPRYGAPLHAGDQGGLPTASSPGVFPAAVKAVTDGSDGRLVGLFVALLVVAAMMFGAAAARRSRRVRT
jgi:hypothetical protein